jgi:hypothetical protein
MVTQVLFGGAGRSPGVEACDGSWTAVAGHRFGFAIDALSPHPKLRQAGALQDTLIATKRLG